MLALLAEIERSAKSSARVLITGESGTGKELVATEIHARSARAAQSFVAVNCASLAETLLESELFGHVRGSFTGAYRDTHGKFELADRGTLFLDEVGEMSLRMQGLLLRVLETGEVQKVGADRLIRRVDVRVVAATNRDLGLMVDDGTFRRDLFYRLNVLPVHVPPLRERAGDIPELADFFLSQWAHEAKSPRRLAPDAYAALTSFSWPGNIRQLENAIHRAVVHSAGEIITAADLPPDVRPPAPSSAALVPFAGQEPKVGETLYERIRTTGADFWTVVGEPYFSHDLTRRDVNTVISLALAEAQGHYTGVAKLLNLPRSDYKRLLNFLRKQGCLPDYRPFRTGQRAS